MENNIKEKFFKELLPYLGGNALMNQITNIKLVTNDYSNNKLAPEPVGYKITFRLYGKLKKYLYFPNTVGFQEI